MKQYVKYILILILGLILHESSASCQDGGRLFLEEADTADYVLMQAPSHTQQALHHWYRHLHQLSLCLDASDSVTVPQIRCILLWVKYLLAEGGTNSPAWYSTHPPHWVSACPQDYYIFTLRKIVV